MATLTLEKFIASVTRTQYRKYGMYNWDSSTIPTRHLLLSEKQMKLYDSLFRQRIAKIEKTVEWNDGTFKLSKNGAGLPSLLHKSGMSFGFTTSIKEKSFQQTDIRNKRSFWIKNLNHSRLVVKFYKPLKLQS